MKVPVRPMPALQCTRMGPAPTIDSCRAFTSCRKLSTQPGSEGTPWSGQACERREQRGWLLAGNQSDLAQGAGGRGAALTHLEVVVVHLPLLVTALLGHAELPQGVVRCFRFRDVPDFCLFVLL